MWKIINNLPNKQSETTLTSEIQYDNQNLSGRTDIANALNLNLNEVVSRLAENMLQSSRTPESYVTTPDAQFIIRNVSVDQIYLSII